MDVTLSLVLTASSSKEWLMTCIAVRCPHCHSEQIGPAGVFKQKPTVSPTRNSRLVQEPEFDFLHGFSGRFSTRNGL
jgi:hypothetical protein